MSKYILKYGFPMVLCDCFQAEDQIERFLVVSQVPICNNLVRHVTMNTGTTFAHAHQVDVV